MSMYFRLQNSKMLQNPLKIHFAGDDTTFIMRSTDKVMTMIEDVKINANSIYIRLLYVDSKFRNQGIGRKVVDDIKEYCIKKGHIREITVEPTKDSIEFWKRLGFKQSKTDSNKYFLYIC